MTDKPIDTESKARQHAGTHAIHSKPTAILHTRQAWRDEIEKEFKPATVLLYLEKDCIRIITALADDNPHNSASSLNDYAWQLGDVFEIFLQLKNQEEYLEIHITPENQRLQLRWTPETFDLVNSSEKSLEEFMVHDPSWIQSRTQIAPNNSLWFVHAEIPWCVFQRGEARKEATLLCAFCRYDVHPEGKKTLSATPAFPRASYHLRDYWHRVKIPNFLP